jgi:hypothetical protein
MFPDDGASPADESQPAPAKAKRASGCLMVALVAGCIALFGVCCAAGGILLISAGMRHSDAYRLALQTAESSPCVAQRLGSPLKTGWFFSGGMRTTNGEGTADLDFPISGPKGSGRMHVFATKFDDTWYLQLLTLSVDGKKIRLLPVPSTCE